MNSVTKKSLINRQGIRIGYIYELIGKVGYVTETEEFQRFHKLFESIKTESRIEVIVIDVTKLLRWDTLSLRSIYPALIAANRDLLSKRKAPISIIGDKTKDPFDAASERHKENGTEVIPWFHSIEAFLEAYSL